MKKTCWTAAFVLLLAASPGARADENVVVAPVAVAGETSPAGGRYILFGDIDVDPARRVTYTASMTTGRVGIFRTRFGVPQTIIQSGDPAPPDAGNRFFIPLAVSGNTAGDLAFVCILAFPDRQGVFLMQGTEVTTLALQGTPAPFGSGLSLAGFDQIRLLESGEVYVLAFLLDELGNDAGTAVLAHDASSLRPVIAAGDPYGGSRMVDRVLQYDVNESGIVAALAQIGDFGFLDPLTEIILLDGGRLRTLASKDLSFSGGTDMVRHFAVAVDQVRVDPAGTASFYVATNNFLGGGYAINEGGGMTDNRYLLSQGHRSPLSSTDTLQFFGPFGRSAGGTLAFQAFTPVAPSGGIFAMRPGSPAALVARTGEPRPGGGTWAGFFHLDMNPAGAFTFTEFQGLAQIGVHLGHLLAPADEILAELRAVLREHDVPRGVRAQLEAMLRLIERRMKTGDTSGAATLATSLREGLERLMDRQMPLLLAELLHPLLEDLERSLGGGSAALRARAPESQAPPLEAWIDTLPAAP
ncbi:MAG: DUF7453 family protein [Candidatus Polarisedimenticolia bacterium]